jgi:hypothetical protein
MEGVRCFHFPGIETHRVKLMNIAMYETSFLPLVFIAVERVLTQNQKAFIM